jgi:hypothetical protein
MDDTSMVSGLAMFAKIGTAFRLYFHSCKSTPKKMEFTALEKYSCVETVVATLLLVTNSRNCHRAATMSTTNGASGDSFVGMSITRLGLDPEE